MTTLRATFTSRASLTAAVGRLPSETKKRTSEFLGHAKCRIILLAYYYYYYSILFDNFIYQLRKMPEDIIGGSKCFLKNNGIHLFGESRSLVPIRPITHFVAPSVRPVIGPPGRQQRAGPGGGVEGDAVREGRRLG